MNDPSCQHGSVSTVPTCDNLISKPTSLFSYGIRSDQVLTFNPALHPSLAERNPHLVRQSLRGFLTRRARTGAGLPKSVGTSRIGGGAHKSPRGATPIQSLSPRTA